MTSEPVTSDTERATATVDEGPRFTMPAVRARVVWAGAFVLLFGIVMARNTFLFTTHMYEGGDTGANSLLVDQALRFDLFHGNYSRVGFYHPGPAFIYVLTAGQWFFHDFLHAVPTPWNGQLIAGFALDSALVAAAVAVIHTWTRSLAATCAAFAAYAGFLALIPEILTSQWFPFFYVPAYVCFLAVAASVAAGRTAHLWVFALSGLLLINGHVAFFLFVTVTALAVAGALLWPQRRHPAAALARYARGHRRQWLPAAAVAVVMAVPTVVGVALHWPGQFGSYIHYTANFKSDGRTLGDVIRYVVQYWWPTNPGALVVLVPFALTTLVLLVADHLAPPHVRRYVHAAVWMNILTTVLMLYYALRGVDNLDSKYIEYFGWSVPMLTLALLALSAVGAIRRERPALVVGAVLALGAAVALAVAQRTSTPTHDNRASAPGTVAQLGNLAGGRTIDLNLVDVGTWTYATALLVQAERTGLHACVVGSSWSVIMDAHICTFHDLATGLEVQLHQIPYSPATATRMLVWADGVAVTVQ